MVFEQIKKGSDSVNGSICLIAKVF